MKVSKEKLVIEKYDKLLAISFGMLAFAFVYIKVFELDVSLALYNIIITMLVPIIFIVTSKIKLNKKSIFTITALIVCGIINCIISFYEASIDDSLEEVGYFITMIINMIMVYGIIQTSDDFKEKYSFKYMNYTIITIAFIFCIYNLFANIGQLELFLNAKYRNIISFSSFFPNRNNFAIFLFFTLITTFFLKNNKENKKIYTILQCFFVLNLILTLSRSGVLSFSVFLLLYLLLTQKKKRYIVMFIILLIFVIIINPYNIVETTKTFLIREEDGASGRVEIWKECVKVIEESPIIGHGDKISENLLKELVNREDAHSFYLKLLMTYGIVGFISVFILIIDLLKKDIYVFKRENKIGAICISTIFAILVYGITEEIRFFSFGLLNILITYLGFTLPIYYYNVIRREKDEC